MKSEEFDRAFDDGEDVTSQLDMSAARRPGVEQRRVNVDFPAWMIEALGREARRLGVNRQSIIKVIAHGPLSGTGARLAALCVLLTAAGASCASPASGGSSPDAGEHASVTVQQPSPGVTVTPVRMTGSPTPEPAGPVPVLKGCPYGTVTIGYPGQGDWAVCVRAGSRLRLTLTDDGYGSWAPLRVTPAGVATVVSGTDPKGNVRATVTPAGTAPFCLGTDLSPTSPTAPDFPWRLCVSIKR